MLLKPYLSIICLASRTIAVRVQDLAPLVLACVGSSPSAARSLVEQVRAEWHFVAHPAAEQIADRDAGCLADQVQRRDLECPDHA